MIPSNFTYQKIMFEMRISPPRDPIHLTSNPWNPSFPSEPDWLPCAASMSEDWGIDSIAVGMPTANKISSGVMLLCRPIAWCGDRRGISLDQLYWVDFRGVYNQFTMKTKQIQTEEIRGGASVRIVHRDARTFFGIRAATVFLWTYYSSKERQKRMQVLWWCIVEASDVYIHPNFVTGMWLLHGYIELVLGLL